MNALWIAVQFLTRLPVPSLEGYNGRDAGRSLLFFPLVGLLLGGALAVGGQLLDDAPAGLAAALVLAAWVLVTGALHLDGLADSADAWVGGHGDRERTLAIMRDPRSGPVGVTLLILVLLVKYAALEALLAENAFGMVALAPLMGRAVLPLLFLTTPYVRPGGLGEAMATHLPRHGAALVVMVSALWVIAAGALRGAGIVIAALLVFITLRSLMRRRLGGATGDTAGALVEVTEAACLAAAAL